MGIHAATDTSPTSVRPAAVAGTWYPDDPKTLASLVDGMLAEVPVVESPSRDIRALVLPHAGYRYSGPVAARAVKRAQGMAFKRVIVLGPAHRSGGYRGLSILDVSAYQTPLGEIPLDQEAITRLRADPLVRSRPSLHAREHSIEMELPLLQRTLAPGWRLVPILVGRISDEQTFHHAADLIRPLLDAQTLVVVSSDFTHYGPRFGYLPFPHDAQTGRHLEELDLGAFRHIAQKDPHGFWEYHERTGITACGFGPLMILLDLLPEDARVERVEYTTSGALTGDFENSVSYVAAVVTDAHALGESTAADPPPDPEGTLSPEHSEQGLPEAHLKWLLGLARRSVQAAVSGSPDAERALKEYTTLVPEPLGRNGAAFVTLREDGRLRGCIGNTLAREPLYLSVAHNARFAALRDPRFNPVETKELDKLDLEISILSAPRPVDSYRDILLGRDGVILRKDGHIAVFLPQVAGEQGWDLEETLTHLSRKADLPSDAWRQGAKLEVFTAQIYPESDEKE